jgi:hypothetical protein
MWVTTQAIAIMEVIKGAWSSLGGLPVVGPALAIAAIAGGIGYVKSQKAGDINSPADGKTQISTKEGGLFELSKNDDVVAFPGASKALNSPSQPLVVNQPTQQSQAIDYDKMAQAMSRVKVQTNLDGVRVSSELQKAPLGIATRKI